ncbi:MAG TPA: CoA pyrophosphatase [Anaerolineaceae bacterium]
MNLPVSPDVLIDRLSGIQYATPSEVGDGTEYSRAAVLIGLIRIDERLDLLYIRRSQNVITHKGQVAFPGGRQEDTDHDAVDTALREAEEEIGLERDNVQILGTLPFILTPTNFLITPVVGWIKNKFQIRLQKSEVDRVFTIPLNWLANPEHHSRRSYQSLTGLRHGVIFYKPYDGETLWGVTAEITQRFINIL